MVLQELGQKLKDALNKLNKSDNIDQKLLKEMLTTLSIALIKSDVNLHLVKKLTTNIQSKFDEIQEETGNKKLMIQKAVVKELQNKDVSSQLLNPPVVINLTGREGELLKEYMDYFEQLGFEIEEFGSGSFAVRSMPTDLYGCNEKELFVEIMDELLENPMKGTPDVILKKLASMACKSAVKGNTKMERAEMEALIDELLTLDNPYHCPHGRPTIISMSKYEIEKKFKRVIS